MDFSTTITVGGKPVIISVPKGTKAWRLANSVFCPLGAAHSQAWLLLSRESVLGLSTSSTHSIVWTVWTDSGGASAPISMPGWALLKAERLLHGGKGDGKALYLCEFVDNRYFADRNSATGEVVANIRSYANDDSYLTETSGKTWTDLITDLWNDCGLLGAFPGLPSSLPIDSVPQNSCFIGLNAWRSLNSVLEHLDCAVRHDPTTNTYTIVQLGADQSLPANSSRLIWDSEPVITGKTAANKLVIHFHTHFKAYGQERDTEVSGNYLVEESYHTLDRTTGVSGAQGEKAIWDDMPWVLDETGTLVNGSDLTTRANNLKTRYAARHNVTPKHQIFSGLLTSYLPGGQVRACLWRNWGDGEENPLGGTVTEFVCGPSLVTGYRQGEGYGPAWFDSELTAPERECYAPPDFGRHSFPNYPRLPNIIQVNQDQATAGDEVSANGDGFHKGRVRRWVNNSMATLEDCWIRFVDDHDNANGAVTAIQGEFYGPGRLSGVSTSQGARLPVYTVRRGPVSDLVRFRLTAELSLGSNADAKILTWNPNTQAWVLGTVTISVYDWFNTTPIPIRTGMFKGEIGYEGWAVLREKASGENKAKYDIVWMENKADWVTFKLTAEISNQDEPTAATYEFAIGANNHGFSRGRDPNPDANTIEVYDVTGAYLHAPVDAIGIAKYNDRNGHYEVVVCNLPVILLEATLNSTLCGSTGSATITREHIHGVFNISHITEQGSTVAFRNPCLRRAESGDTVILEYDLLAKEFTLLQIQAKISDMVVNVRFQDGCWQKLVREVAVESCEAEPTVWEDIICGDPC